MRETFQSTAVGVPTAGRLPPGIGPADLDLIHRTPLLCGLDRPALLELLEHAAVRPFERNAVLFQQDEPAACFYIVLDGWVRLYRETAGGQESTIAILTRGESFAEATMFLGGTYPVTAAVVNRARLLMIRAEPFLRQLRAHPDLALNMLASMSVHLRRLVRQVEQLTVRSSTERLADFLLKLAPGRGGSATIELPWDKALVATRLGMRPETLSRSLARLRDLGVEAQGGQIKIQQLEALRRYLAGNP
ncbi:MAG TPA: Crp/Fnr family transcriptional regulator [Geminicoccaceae bacterium]|nr:Crp/Fnr family transcriptional regulator [Geminicoccaceae bacterium]